MRRTQSLPQAVKQGPANPDNHVQSQPIFQGFPINEDFTRFKSATAKLKLQTKMHRSLHALLRNIYIFSFSLYVQFDSAGILSTVWKTYSSYPCWKKDVLLYNVSHLYFLLSFYIVYTFIHILFPPSHHHYWGPNYSGRCLLADGWWDFG